VTNSSCKTLSLEPSILFLWDAGTFLTRRLKNHSYTEIWRYRRGLKITPFIMISQTVPTIRLIRIWWSLASMGSGISLEESTILRKNHSLWNLFIRVLCRSMTISIWRSELTGRTLKINMINSALISYMALGSFRNWWLNLNLPVLFSWKVKHFKSQLNRTWST